MLLQSVLLVLLSAVPVRSRIVHADLELTPDINFPAAGTVGTKYCWLPGGQCAQQLCGTFTTTNCPDATLNPSGAAYSETVRPIQGQAGRPPYAYVPPFGAATSNLCNASGNTRYGNFTQQTACCCRVSRVCTFPPHSTNSSANLSNVSNALSAAHGTCAGTCNYLTKKCPAYDLDFDLIPKPVIISNLTIGNVTNLTQTTLFTNGLWAPYYVLIRTYENSGAYETRFYGYLDQTCQKDSEFIQYNTTGSWHDEGIVWSSGGKEDQAAKNWTATKRAEEEYALRNMNSPRGLRSEPTSFSVCALRHPQVVDYLRQVCPCVVGWGLQLSVDVFSNPKCTPDKCMLMQWLGMNSLREQYNPFSMTTSVQTFPVINVATETEVARQGRRLSSSRAATTNWQLHDLDSPSYLRRAADDSAATATTPLSKVTVRPDIIYRIYCEGSTFASTSAYYQPLYQCFNLTYSNAPVPYPVHTNSSNGTHEITTTTMVTPVVLDVFSGLGQYQEPLPQCALGPGPFIPIVLARYIYSKVVFLGVARSEFTEDIRTKLKEVIVSKVFHGILLPPQSNPCLDPEFADTDACKPPETDTNARREDTSDSTNSTSGINTRMIFFNRIDAEFVCHYVSWNDTYDHNCVDSTVFDTFIKVDSLNDVGINENYTAFVADNNASGLRETFANHVLYDAPAVKLRLSSTYFMIKPVIYEGNYSQTGSANRPSCTFEVLVIILVLFMGTNT